MSGPRIRASADGTLLDIRVAPGAAREGVAGLHDGALKLAVRAAPEKGKANKAALKLLAGVLGCRASDLEVARGPTARSKTVLCRGLGVKRITERVQAHLTTWEKAR